MDIRDATENFLLDLELSGGVVVVGSKARKEEDVYYPLITTMGIHHTQ